MKASEASGILDDRIDDFMTLVKDYHQIDEAEFGSAASQGTAEIYAVGRIACDSAEGKLNAASVVLETSRKTGAGRRVPLNVSKLPGYQIFPGQIVALKGINSSGSEFIVQEILEVPLLPNAASAPATIEAHRERLRGGPDAMESDDEPAPLNVLFGSGPYTTDDNLDFEPLHALCSQAADTCVDALVLCGPFIDIDHPLIATGDFDLPDDAPVDPDTSTMSTVFKYMISPALNRLAVANPAITILLVPSVRDVIDKHVSWPQDPFPRKDLGLPKAVRIIGNPMTLSLNEMVLGISSQDALYELRHEELFAKGAKSTGDLLSRLPRHMIEQRHYYPVFPPTDRSKLPKTGTSDGRPAGAALDTSYLMLGDMVNVRPDVLVTPSSLPPFARVRCCRCCPPSLPAPSSSLFPGAGASSIPLSSPPLFLPAADFTDMGLAKQVVESVLVINPGYLSKRRGAGTYARMSLYPPKVSDDASGMVSHKVFSRARVEITRI